MARFLLLQIVTEAKEPCPPGAIRTGLARFACSKTLIFFHIFRNNKFYVCKNAQAYLGVYPQGDGMGCCSYNAQHCGNINPLKSPDNRSFKLKLKN